ncbi:hypothetical protein DOS70_02640 [Staphylococcus felis]|uniref:Uncharacterized protein n=2 Tax=Staphylococcus felis TaxID=46127 RepID=A0A2K3ZF26_9STAP|nr:hypothetical protein [Staphylococcus felis]AVP36029.1 hypothetical protein C7J90_03330 [Staphylococcus felis]MBH9581396.1 hypothetical protein [Staphylococcus felis]PNZ36465.1 hypothetical protein CD143_03970 [Staphylococcus felis]QQB04001.1 hypothetical protein I6H71_03350 [Staphylococcus felis]REH77170.1 hypothetical protein DOS60_06180 [Staphylococcus felis]
MMSSIFIVLGMICLVISVILCINEIIKVKVEQKGKMNYKIMVIFFALYVVLLSIGIMIENI